MGNSGARWIDWSSWSHVLEPTYSGNFLNFSLFGLGMSNLILSFRRVVRAGVRWGYLDGLRDLLYIRQANWRLAL